MTITLQLLSDQILTHAGSRRRTIVAIAGPPGAGKSTLSEALASKLSAQTSVAVLAQDGYHFDNQVLIERDCLARKGAPHTFDVTAFALMLGFLKDQHADISAPVFNRDLEMVCGCASIIKTDDRIILVEGNYLLLRDHPWSTLMQYFDHTILLKPPLEVVQRRLTERWRGYQMSPEEIGEKLDGNDMPNARTVLDRSVSADHIVTDLIALDN